MEAVRALMDEYFGELCRRNRVPTQVRITDAAFRWSPASVPLGVSEEEYEILIHPEDWRAVLLAFEPWETKACVEQGTFYGVPVVQ